MIFYGTKESLTQWRSLIAKELSKIGSKIEQESSVSFTFTIDLSDQERQHLQDNVWHRVEDDTNLPWNHRIAWVDPN